MADRQEAFVTTLNTDNYLPGVLALDMTIREHCRHSLFVLVSHGLSESTYEALRRRDIDFGYAEDITVDPVLFAHIGDDYTHWMNTLFKLRIFELTQFDKIVFIDSDIMLLESLDDLFDWPDMSAVVAGGSYPGNENWHELGSGVMTIEPRAELVPKLVEQVPSVAAQKKNFGDQDVLIAYFADWPQQQELHLPESCNVFLDHCHYYLKHGGVRALHFIGKTKPWMETRAQTLRSYVRCLVKGNASAIGLLRRYHRLLREVTADE